jgi:hypothetical protein
MLVRAWHGQTRVATQSSAAIIYFLTTNKSITTSIQRATIKVLVLEIVPYVRLCLAYRDVRCCLFVVFRGPLLAILVNPGYILLSRILPANDCCYGLLSPSQILVDLIFFIKFDHLSYLK